MDIPKPRPPKPLTWDPPARDASYYDYCTACLASVGTHRKWCFFHPDFEPVTFCIFCHQARGQHQRGCPLRADAKKKKSKSNKVTEPKVEKKPNEYCEWSVKVKRTAKECREWIRDHPRKNKLTYYLCPYCQTYHLTKRGSKKSREFFRGPHPF